MEIPQLPKIIYYASEAFIAHMHEFLDKYADVFTKPGKPVARDIKHKIDFLEPEEPIPHQLQQK